MIITKISSLNFLSTDVFYTTHAIVLISPKFLAFAAYGIVGFCVGLCMHSINIGKPSPIIS